MERKALVAVIVLLGSLLLISSTSDGTDIQIGRYQLEIASDVSDQGARRQTVTVGVIDSVTGEVHVQASTKSVEYRDFDQTFTLEDLGFEKTP